MALALVLALVPGLELVLGLGLEPVPGLVLEPVPGRARAWHKPPEVMPIRLRLNPKPLVSVSFFPP